MKRFYPHEYTPSNPFQNTRFFSERIGTHPEDEGNHLKVPSFGS